MTALLIIVGIAALALLLRPAPRTHVVYMPVEVTEEHSGFGCLPLIILGIALVIALRLMSL